MATKRNALGKGLSALLENYETDVTSGPSDTGSTDSSSSDHKVAGSIANIPVDAIKANPEHPGAYKALGDCLFRIQEYIF